MYEQDYVLVERFSSGGVAVAATEIEQVQAAPAQTSYPTSNVRIFGETDIEQPEWKEQPYYVVPEGYEIFVDEDQVSYIAIGGIHLNNLEVTRAQEHTAHSHSLAIDGVSNDEYRARLEGRRGRIRRALGRLVGWLNTRPSSSTQAPETTDEMAATRHLALVPESGESSDENAA